MGRFDEQIAPLESAALNDFQKAADLAALDQARVQYLGANGALTGLMKQLSALSKEEKPAAGKLLNLTKQKLEEGLSDRRAELELKAAQPKDAADFTLPGR